MRIEAVDTVLGSKLERTGISSGVVPLNSEAGTRANLLEISGSIASSSESPVNRILLQKKLLTEPSLAKIKKESAFSRKRGYHDKNGKWVLYRRSGRGGRCRAAGEHEYLGCGSPRCVKRSSVENKKPAEQPVVIPVVRSRSNRRLQLAS